MFIILKWIIHFNQHSCDDHIPLSDLLVYGNNGVCCSYSWPEMYRRNLNRITVFTHFIRCHSAVHWNWLVMYELVDLSNDACCVNTSEINVHLHKLLYTSTWSPLTHMYITPIVKGANPLLRGDLFFSGFTWPQITDILCTQNYFIFWDLQVFSVWAGIVPSK